MVSKLQQCLFHTHKFSEILFPCPYNYKYFTTLYSPQSNNYVRSIIKSCKSIKDLKTLKSLIIVNGLTNYKLIISDFIQQCFHLGTPKFALSSFYASNNTSLLLQNLIIKHLCNLGLYKDVINVYKTCKILGISNGSYTFPYVIKACSNLCYVNLGKEIHCVVIRNGYSSNVYVQASFIDFYAKIRRMDVARKVFDEMSEFDIVSWNALISGYSCNGFYFEAIRVFQEFCVKGFKPNVVTLASIVPICTCLGFRNLGRCLHGYGVKYGVYKDEVLIPALISLYASHGDIDGARCLFDLSLDKNVVVWNSIIYAYVQNQMPKVSFEIFQHMLAADVCPNVATFVSIISCCEKFSAFCYGEILHGYATKYGVDNQVSVATALISMYGKLGYVHLAENVFTWMSQRNVLTWNSIISVYVHHGLSQTSLDAAPEMISEGFKPDSISIINILSACSELKNLLLGKSAHAISLRKGFDLNINVANSLLGFYFDCHLLTSAIKLFDLMPSKNVISWNTMISGCVSSGDPENAAAYFRGMILEGVQPDAVSLICFLPGLSGSVDLVQGMALHGFALKSGFTLDVKLANAVINTYCCCRNLDAASLFFRTMPYKCLVSWNSLITGYQCHGLYKEVIFLFKQMIRGGQNPNYITLLNVLPACSTLMQSKSVHSYAIRTGTILRIPFVTSLISMYSKFNNIDSCFLLFDANKSDISLWNVMMSVLVEARDVHKVFLLFSDLLQTEVRMDHVTVLNIISACTQLNNNKSCIISLLALVIKNGLLRETTVSNVLIDLYSKIGVVQMARTVFKSLPEKDAISWSTMINGYGLNGDGEGAISLFSLMQNSGMKPDRITYLSILSACSHAGLADQSIAILNSMLNNGIQPTYEHYACVVDLLGRKGLLLEAFDTLERMPSGASVGMLESLLGACMVHENVEVGEVVGELLIHKEPDNAGAYVRLHNIYASAERWQDANRIRGVMEDKGLSKVTGISMLERMKL